MPDSRGREYAVNPLGGKDELKRTPDNIVYKDEIVGRVYAPAQPEPAPTPSTPPPAMEVEADDVVAKPAKKTSAKKASS